ncbi:MAG: winged helix-turn-helix transcriptional regulator [Candidatus Freyarchaeota archaeon]|nr:winged helix-turn-helix transcriptional regulator [Candidatus Jordarchaeia archaeon]MBS7268778.1 winged helix-turn-helix transcriptional regulator [Candidatus Jordarchaeia archaeon]MBS7278238.1 winged helix-turn-helix transcriptional regulator [Candidatus Jordarchaeia archaeon]
MDDIDRKIIEQLCINGRVTLQEMSKKIGYTSMGVKKRLDKLTESGLIKNKALLNASLVNLYLALVFLEIETEEDMRKIIEKFQKCPRIIKMFKSMGGYNLIAIVVAEDQSTLECISMGKCSLRSQKGIRRSDFYPVAEVYYDPYIDLNLGLRREYVKPPCGVDCKNCVKYQEEKCVACPSTSLYKGKIY